MLSKRIILLALLLSIALVSLTAFKTMVSDPGLVKEVARPLVIAQMLETRGEETTQSELATKQQKSAVGAEQATPESKKKSPPVKKFEPTEKIEADNAVDFPVDI
jgi:uncharacterized protein YqhQ